MICPSCKTSNDSDNLQKNSCSFCGFVIGLYGRFKSNLTPLPENNNKYGFQNFGSRYKVKSRRLSKYTETKEFRQKHKKIQEYLMKNHGTAYTYNELSDLLYREFGNYSGLANVLKHMMKWGMIKVRGYQGDVYYTIR